MYVHVLHNSHAPTIDWYVVARVTIDMLPDIALLRIFDFYLVEARIGRMWFNLETVETWSALVHVCQKWRNIVFGSPRRLDLRLFYTTDTKVSEMLDIWPLLPIAIRVEGGWSDSLATSSRNLTNTTIAYIQSFSGVFQVGHWIKS
jgi:hypothetical protein